VVAFAMNPHREEEEVTPETVHSSSIGFHQLAVPGTTGSPPAPTFLQVRLSCSQRFPTLTAPRRSPSRSLRCKVLSSFELTADNLRRRVVFR
jgi:hypothetical protein